jgi:hypothetical protein
MTFRQNCAVMTDIAQELQFLNHCRPTQSIWRLDRNPAGHWPLIFKEI